MPHPWSDSRRASAEQDRQDARRDERRGQLYRRCNCRGRKLSGLDPAQSAEVDVRRQTPDPPPEAHWRRPVGNTLQIDVNREAEQRLQACAARGHSRDPGSEPALNRQDDGYRRRTCCPGQEQPHHWPRVVRAVDDRVCTLQQLVDVLGSHSRRVDHDPTPWVDAPAQLCHDFGLVPADGERGARGLTVQGLCCEGVGVGKTDLTDPRPHQRFRHSTTDATHACDQYDGRLKPTLLDE